jgi:dihydromethanopterin reductase
MPIVRAMCAIGERGQLGLHGRLPWEGHQGREFVADVERFFSVTEGHVIAAGPTTTDSIPDFARTTRTVFTIRSHMTPAEVIGRFPDRVIFIGGGPPVWTAFAHLIEHWDITRLPYDGEADRWFDPAWLVQSAPPAG